LGMISRSRGRCAFRVGWLLADRCHYGLLSYPTDMRSPSSSAIRKTTAESFSLPNPRC
jgi:hypothetical protein